MDASFPIPAGLDIPELAEGETIDFMTTYTVSEGMLIPLAIEGEPVTGSEEGEEEELSEDEDSFQNTIETRLR